MRVLVACEQSGVVRDAFRQLGHDAYSNDMWDVEVEGIWDDCHLNGDCRQYLDGYQGIPWDLMIAHPPCTYLCASGKEWDNIIKGRREKEKPAVDFVKTLWAAPIPRICLENPIGVLTKLFRPPDQIIQPYHFGHNATKKTCLWLKNLPHLIGRSYFPPRLVRRGSKVYERWGNQSDAGNDVTNSTQSKLRSRTYAGIAEAMAEQWGVL